jgi:hypothetical protein
MPITVVNMHHLPGRALPAGDPSFVYIGRPRGNAPLGLGNPFRVGAEYKQGEAVEAFRQYARTEWNNPQNPLRQQITALAQRALAGEDLKLVCWCKPKACHGDVIKEAIEALVLRLQATPSVVPVAPPPPRRPSP